MDRAFALVCATALVCGCATPPPPLPGTGAGAAYTPMVDMQGVDSDALAEDVATCRDVASSVRVMRVKGASNDMADALVLGVAIVVPFGFVGMALISGIAASLSDEGKGKPADATLQQKTLVNCIARKGYRNVDPNVTVTYVAPPRPAPDAQKLRAGRDTYVAESYVRANHCPDGPARALLESKGPGFERYSVACSNGRRIALRCEFGNCAQQAMEVAASD